MALPAPLFTRVAALQLPLSPHKEQTLRKQVGFLWWPASQSGAPSTSKRTLSRLLGSICECWYLRRPADARRLTPSVLVSVSNEVPDYSVISARLAAGERVPGDN